MAITTTPKPKPDAASLATVRARLHMVEHCIVRDVHAAAEQLRELARLLDAVAEHSVELERRLAALERGTASPRAIGIAPTWPATETK